MGGQGGCLKKEKKGKERKRPGPASIAARTGGGRPPAAPRAAPSLSGEAGGDAAGGTEWDGSGGTEHLSALLGGRGEEVSRGSPLKATRLGLKARVRATGMALPSPNHGAAPRAPGRAPRTGGAPAPPASLLPPPAADRSAAPLGPVRFCCPPAAAARPGPPGSFAG